MKCSILANTDGSSLYSDKIKPVKIINIYLNYLDGNDFGELHALFDSSWNTTTDGLIYTDSGWLKEFNIAIVKIGGMLIDYSEQGMQGENYVSMDVDGEFLSSTLGMELIEEYLG